MANADETEGKKYRTTIFIEPSLVNKLDHIAGMQYTLKGKAASRTDIINEAFTEYVERFEKKHGVIPVK